MEDLVKAIEKLAEKTGVDYLLIIVPIVISIVAIGIAIYTANKQNRIALFQLRYQALSRLKRVLLFEESVLPNATPADIVDGANVFFLIDIKQEIVNGVPWNQYIKITSFLSEVENDLAVLHCYIPKEQQEAIDNMLTQLAEILADAISNRHNSDAIQILHQECKKFPEKDIKKLEKKFKL